MGEKREIKRKSYWQWLELHFPRERHGFRRAVFTVRFCSFLHSAFLSIKTTKVRPLFRKSTTAFSSFLSAVTNARPVLAPITPSDDPLRLSGPSPVGGPLLIFSSSSSSSCLEALSFSPKPVAFACLRTLFRALVLTTLFISSFVSTALRARRLFERVLIFLFCHGPPISGRDVIGCTT